MNNIKPIELWLVFTAASKQDFELFNQLIKFVLLAILLSTISADITGYCVNVVLHFIKIDLF